MKKITLPNGIQLRGMGINTSQDWNLFREMLADLSATDPLQAAVRHFGRKPERQWPRRENVRERGAGKHAKLRG